MKSSPVQWAACGAAALSVALLSGAQAQSVSTAEGVGADTFLSNDSSSGPDDVHGADETANVRHLGTLTSSGPPDFEEIYTGVRSRLMLLRFDLTGQSGPFVNARLELTQTFSRRNRTLDVYALADGEVENWDEATTSYSNAPGVDAADEGLYAIDAAEATFLGTYDVIDSRDVEPVVLSSDPASLPLDDLLSADSNGVVSLLVAYPMPNTDSNPDFLYATKENTGGLAAPTLSWAPEPSSVLLLLSGLIGLAAGRRSNG